MMGRYGGTGNGMARVVRAEIRVRVAAGETWPVVARAVGVSVRTVARVLKEAGGMPPRWTVRSARQLSFGEREEISIGLCCGESFSAIGRRLGRACSTVSREVNANGGRHRYRVSCADERAYQCSRRPSSASST
jgi:hypothetical protein